MKSIRQNLTLRLLVGTSLLLIAASIILYLLVRSILLEGFDHALEAKARALATLTSSEGHRIEFDFDGDYMPEYEDEDDPEFYWVQFQDGTFIDQSETFEELDSDLPALSSQTKTFGNLELPEGEQGRYVQMKVLPISEEPDAEEEIEEEDIIFMIPDSVDPDSALVVITVARSRKELDQTLGFLSLSICGLDLLVLGAIFLVVKSSIKKGLNPIDEINSQISQIEPETLEKRVGLNETPTELSTIIQALNGLLDRMNVVITRERRFTSDVAHELRTPVSELRTACEVGLLSPEDPETTSMFLNDINDIARQMEKVVSNLLSLSRWDQEKAPVSSEEVELEPLIKNCWQHCEKEADAKGIKLDCHIEPRTLLVTDREKFEMIVQNLLDNAVAYSVAGSRIRCTLEPGNPSLNLQFENHAANLCREDLKHLFDRFWRKEVARSEVHHSGLGLSIVKALADMLKISIHPELLEDRWFRIRLNIPV